MTPGFDEGFNELSAANCGHPHPDLSVRNIFDNKKKRREKREIE